MGKLQDIANGLSELTEESIKQAALQSFSDNQRAATDLNTDQLFQGKQADGGFLPDYSERSVTVFGKPPGPMRLFETGAFYRGFFVKVEKDKAVFGSTDS